MRNYELRITNYELRRGQYFRPIGYFSFAFCFLSLLAISVPAQQLPIATFRPDRAAPGMNVVVEILAPAGGSRPFGYDSLDAGNIIELVHSADSNRVVFGPPIVSWNGNLIQVPLFILPNASLGTVPFYIFSPTAGFRSDTISFVIAAPQHLGAIAGNATIGNGLG